MKELLRLAHDYMNALTSISGFIDLAFGEPERSKRYEHMRRAQKEVRRAVKIAEDLRDRLETKARQYDEKD